MKRQILSKLKWFYAFFVIVLLYTGCDVLDAFSGRTSAEFSLVTELAGVNTTHIPNDKFFYVNLKPGHYEGEGYNPLDALIYAMDEGPGTDCKIPVEKESTEDLYCLMDIMEGDLWYHSLVLEYNVPEGMCDFLYFDVPWHLNQKVGRGPSKVYQCDNSYAGCSEDGSSVQTETRYCLGGCTADSRTCGDDTQAVTISCADGGGSQKEVQDFCRLTESGTSGLDLSGVDLGNCCFGEYELHAGDTITSSPWGGIEKDCIGGLGRISWSDYKPEVTGIPTHRKENTKADGLIEEYNIPSIYSVYNEHRNTKAAKRKPSSITANYWTGVEDKDFLGNMPRIYKAPTATQLPSSSLEVYDIPNPHRTGYPYLTWSCLDKALETKHRIHLAIREWNTQEEFNIFVESKGGRGDPDVKGEEGSICEYYEAEEKEILRDTDCNDVWDLDDLGSVEAGSGRQYNPYPEVIYK